MVTRMAQRTSQTFGVIGEEVREHLQGHVPAELRIVGTVHLAHPALADLGGDFVRAEAGA